MMDQVTEALRQVRDGTDFSAPAAVFKIAPARAVAKLEGWPYSIAENIAHAEFWQRLWLAKLRGEAQPKFDRKLWDWPCVEASEWQSLRRQFLEGLDDAVAFAAAGAPGHRLESDEAAARVLLEIAVHDAYHVGQCVLLKRMLGRTPPV